MFTASGAPTTSAISFTGREADGTGLVYYRARYYDPRRQRFVGEDPIEFAGGDINLYTYVGNQPTMWRDPDGLAVLRLPRVKGPFIDLKPHPFPIIGPQPHIQVNIWLDGIPGIQTPSEFCSQADHGGDRVLELSTQHH